MATLTPAQANLLEALDLYWRAYDRGPSFEDACVLAGAPNATVELTLEFLARIDLIVCEGKWFFVTASGRQRLRKLGRYPFDPNPVRPQSCSCEGTAVRIGGVELQGPASSAAGTFEAQP